MLLHGDDPSAPLNRYPLAVIGIGNTLAGDDGAGVVCIDRLRARWGDHPDVLLLVLDGDLFTVADIVDQVERILFVDAVAGQPPGRIVRSASAPRAMSASLHQTDIGTVMASLEALGYDLPPWEIWGITIDPPQELGEGLSPAVAAGVADLVERLDRAIAAFRRAS